MRVRASLRLMVATWVLQLKLLSRSLFFLQATIAGPLVYAAVAFYLFRGSARPDALLYAAFGAAFMGIWQATLWGAGGSLQFLRTQQLLELHVAAPAPLAFVLLTLSLATATIGAYALATTILLDVVVFNVPFAVAHPLALVVALLAVAVALTLFGFFLATSFILYRSGFGLAAGLDYPIWLVSGMLVPVSFLPGWAAGIGYALPPTWGIRAVQAAISGGHPLLYSATALALGTLYLGAGIILLRVFERQARVRATLSLT